MTAHKHAALMLQYAQDAQETDKSWERWEFALPGGQHWESAGFHPAWYPYHEYRRKPKMMKATCADGTKVTWPEPLREAPELGTWVYSYVFVDLNGDYYALRWTGGVYDRTKLENGILHLTKEAAIQHEKAQICLNNGSAN